MSTETQYSSGNVVVLPYGSSVSFEVAEELEELINKNATESELHNFIENNSFLLPAADPTKVISRFKVHNLKSLGFYSNTPAGSLWPQFLIHSIHPLHSQYEQSIAAQCFSLICLKL